MIDLAWEVEAVVALIAVGVVIQVQGMLVVVVLMAGANAASIIIVLFLLPTSHYKNYLNTALTINFEIITMSSPQDIVPKYNLLPYCNYACMAYVFYFCYYLYIHTIVVMGVAIYYS